MTVKKLGLVVNASLAGVAGYGIHEVTLDNPYAYASLAIMMVYGIVGVIKSIKCTAFFADTYDVAGLVCECMTLPLMNLHYYSSSDKGKELALCHGLSAAIPLTFALITRCDIDTSSAQKLIDLTILGNIVSLTFLAVNENNPWYGGVAMAAFITKFAIGPMECRMKFSVENAITLGNTAFAGLALQSILSKG